MFGRGKTAASDGVIIRAFGFDEDEVALALPRDSSATAAYSARRPRVVPCRTGSVPVRRRSPEPRTCLASTAAVPARRQQPVTGCRASLMPCVARGAGVALQ